jgi:hypothetical protein
LRAKHQSGPANILGVSVTLQQCSSAFEINIKSLYLF